MNVLMIPSKYGVVITIQAIQEDWPSSIHFSFSELVFPENISVKFIYLSKFVN